MGLYNPYIFCPPDPSLEKELSRLEKEKGWEGWEQGKLSKRRVDGGSSGVVTSLTLETVGEQERSDNTKKSMRP